MSATHDGDVAAPAPADAQASVDDGAFMQLALEEARRARAAGEVPVGCVMVHEGAVIATGRNAREALQDPTAHAEMVAIRAAAAHLGSFRLIGVTCYVTLEPCPMCAGALVNGRVSRVVYGCDDPKAGATTSLYRIGVDGQLNHRFDLLGGVLRDECAAELSGFFEAIRARRRQGQ